MTTQNFEQQLLDKLKEYGLISKKTTIEDPTIVQELIKNAVELIEKLENDLESVYAELAGEDY